MRASEIVSRRVSGLEEDAAPGDLLWIPCRKTPAGRRTLEVPEVLRPLLVECAEGKAPASYIVETEEGKSHWRYWTNRPPIVSAARTENKNTAHLCAVLKFPGGAVGDRTPDL